MIILGVDPGIARLGYAVIAKNGGKFECLKYGCVSTEKGGSLDARLFELSEKLKSIVSEYKPDKIGMEKLFFSKNVKTAMTVGQARGAALLTVAGRGIPITEFAPNEIKQSVTGYGAADKKQVQKMVKIIFNLKEIPSPDDAADALAIAYACGVNS